MAVIAAMILSLALQDQDRIQDLIQKLGSDDFSTREQASEELKKTGKNAREALKKAADESQDPEVRQRARTILDEMAKAEKAPPQPRRAAPGQGGFQERLGADGERRLDLHDHAGRRQPRPDVP